MDANYLHDQKQKQQQQWKSSLFVSLWILKFVKWNCTRLFGQLLLVAICFEMLAYSYISSNIFNAHCIEQCTQKHNFKSFWYMCHGDAIQQNVKCRRGQKKKQNKRCNQHEVEGTHIELHTIIASNAEEIYLILCMCLWLSLALA